ncbi:MAG: hypothetical protein ACOC2O_02000 [Bacillota bacterium]
MKKIIIFSLITAVVMMFSVGVLADQVGPDPITNEDFEIDQGWYKNYSDAQDILSTTQEYTDIDTDYKTVEEVEVTGDVPDYGEEEIGDQKIKVKINTSALIPCYLEMELIGNAGLTKAKSIGAGEEANIDRTDEEHWMLFNPKFGGIMDEDWNLLADGDVEEYSSLGPDNNHYINACDMWTANLYANIDYGFKVDASPLVNINNDEYSLKMDMRVTNEEIIDISSTNTSGKEYTDLGEADIGEDLGDFDALEDTSLYMQFRVPFSSDVPAGQYDGDVTFCMYTI